MGRDYNPPGNQWFGIRPPDGTQVAWGGRALVNRHGIDVSHDRQQWRGFCAGAVLVRKATNLHCLEVVSGPVWTAVVVGPTLRKWGYQTAQGWVAWDEYKGRRHEAME